MPLPLTLDLLAVQQELVEYLLSKKSQLMGHVDPVSGGTRNYNSFV